MCIFIILVSNNSNDISEKDSDITIEINETNNQAKAIVLALGCEDRTAQSILEQIETQIGEKIKDVKSENNVDVVVLSFNTESDEKYTAIIGPGYTLDEIHLGDENGKRIYWSME